MKNAKMLETFDRMTAAMTAHNAEVARVAAKFTRDIEQARKKYAPYRESDRLIRDTIGTLIPAARTAILSASSDLSDVLRAGAEAMLDDLQDRLCKPVSDHFLKQLRVYTENHLMPGRAEVQSLMILNGGNLLGLRLLKTALQSLECGFTFDFRDINSYEKELTEIAAFANSIRHNPAFAVSNVAVVGQFFREFGRDEKLVAGDLGDKLEISIVSPAYPIRNSFGRETGDTWNSDTLVAAAARHDHIAKLLTDIQPYWTDPDNYPEVLSNPSAAAKQVSREKARKQAVAEQIVSQYTE